MRTDWQASYLDGRTAVRRPVIVRLMREGLEVSAPGGPSRFWPYGEVRQTQGTYAGEEVRLERGGALPETLVIADAAFLVSLHEAAAQAGIRFHDPRRRAARIRLTVVAAVAVVAVTAVIYLWGIPLLASVVTPRVPVAWEERVGRSAMTHLAPPDRQCRDPELLAAMDEIVRRLVAASEPAPYTFRVYVVNRPTVNALTAPGGHVLVFRGLLRRTQSPEQLAGVVAHELQHVLRRHATRAVIQDLSSGLLLMALTGDATGPLAYGLRTARTLGALRYSRQAEDEADAEGMRMVLAARVDSAGMLAFFEELQRQEGDHAAALAYASTHPATADRLARLRAIAAARQVGHEPLLPGADWGAVKARC
jgi:beta-barrel assembly-enhancing protease